VLGAFLDLSVTDSLANVHVTFDLPSGKTVTVSDTAPAAQTIDTCNSRYALIFVTTNVTVQLKYLGKTEIKVYYFAACTP
jgi:hypothetical protein